LDDQDLQKLRGGITEYFEAYYAEVRRLIETYNAYDDVPTSYQGCRRVLTTLGTDGIVITHWSALGDSFEFEVSRESTEEIIAKQTNNFSSRPDLARYSPETAGRRFKVITIENAHRLRILPHTAGRDFGAVTIQEPVKVPTEDGTLWITGWTRLDAASIDNLYTWTNAAKARTEARDHLSRYLG
jgi:hypothetical protein